MRPGRIDLLTAKTISTTNLPPLDWVVEPFFVHGDRVVCAGESRAFKTWILLSLGLHVAAGKDWLGFKVGKPRSVLYVDEEMNYRTLVRRVKRIAAGSGIELDSVPFAAMSQQGVRFHAEAAKNLVANLVPHKFDPEFVIVEALVRVLVGDENEAEDVAQFWRNVIPLTAYNKRTVLFSHHLTKAND
jgi:regulatory protein RepA